DAQRLRNLPNARSPSRQRAATKESPSRTAPLPSGAVREARAGRQWPQENRLRAQRRFGCELLAAATQEAAIGGVANGRVLEEIARMRRAAAGEDEAGLGEPGESLLQLALGMPGHQRQQLVGEFAADRGGDLGGFLRRLADTVETRHQRR